MVVQAVLTVTPHSYGKGQISTPYKIKTPERIGIEFGTVDYVLEIHPKPNLVLIGSEASGEIWEIYDILLPYFSPN